MSWLKKIVEALKPCTCGSGAHPRYCAYHPEMYDLHILEMNLDNWRASCEEAEAKLVESDEKLAKLVAAVAKHRDDRGHARCWENDLELYRAAGLELPEPQLPALSEHKKECDKYRAGLYNVPLSMAEDPTNPENGW